MARFVVALLSLGACLGLATGSRMLGEQISVGRQLLDINAGTTSTTFNLTAFGTGKAPGGNCYLQGYPGSRADSTVAGPLTVSVPVGSSLTIGFTRGSSSYFANYNYSGYVDDTSLVQNSSYGLVSVTFKPSVAGHYVNVFSGLVSGSDPITMPTCLVNITINGVSPPTPPPSPSPPTPTTGACYGSVPCYCQNNYCFNNGASLDPNCNTGKSGCTPVTINPSEIGIQYAYGYPSSVNVCKCPATAG